jgi:hypothetical protein
MQKNKNVAVLAVMVLLCLAGNILALGQREEDIGETKMVRVNGRIRLVGSSPMNSLVISGKEREWYVEPNEQKKFMHLQQQTITVEGREYFVDQTFANGLSAGRRYYLKNIKIVKEPGAGA